MTGNPVPPSRADTLPRDATMTARSNTRMTAIVCHGPEDYRVEQVERPTPGARELVIRVGA